MYSSTMVRPKEYDNEEEKAAARRDRDRERKRGRIELGDQVDRWRQVGISESLSSNADIARFLLDL